MNLSVLIPWRTDNGHRQRLWDYCRPLWEQYDIELCIGTDPLDDHPFSPARAFNNAAQQATGDAYVMYGADHIPDPWHLAWVAEQLTVNAWCAVYANTGTYSPEDTEQILTGTNPGEFQYAQIVHHCVGILAIHPDAWHDTGGMDERFEAWGAEDYAYRTALHNLYGPTPEPTGTLPTLWHPPSPRTETNNSHLAEEYNQAQATGTMRQLIDRIRTERQTGLTN